MVELLVWSFFCLFSITIVVSGVFIFLSEHIIYIMYALMAILLSVAGIFILLGADFLAVSQLMIYVGGVLVLMLFGVMLGAPGATRNNILKVKNVNGLWSVIVAIILLISIISLISRLNFSQTFAPNLEAETVKEIGMSLMTQNLLILEILGILLLLALIGTTYLSKTKND